MAESESDKVFRYEAALGLMQDVLFEYTPDIDLLILFRVEIEGNNVINKTYRFENYLLKLEDSKLIHKDYNDVIRSICLGEIDNAKEIKLNLPFNEDDNYYWYEVSCKKFHSFSGKILTIGSFHSIHERKTKEESLKEISMKDSLTDLLNRRAIELNIDVYVDSAISEGMAALLFVDIDNFKGVNDSFGHAMGDEVLRVFSSEIKRLFRATDIIGRSGGDEFIIFMKDIKDLDIVSKKAEAIRRIFSESSMDVYKELSCSIGIAVFPKDTRRPQELFEKADKALYFAKESGKNTFKFYE